MRKLVGLMLCAAPSAAWAQEITFEFDERAAQYGVDTTSVEAQMNDAIGGQLKLDAPQAWLEQMAAANALTTKGMGVDYASNPQRFVVGGSFGSAVNGAGVTFVKGEAALPEGGFAVQAAAMAAVNLGAFAKDESFFRRFVLSVNGMKAGGATGPFHADFYNVGAHLQIKLVRPPHDGVVEWGGIDLTGGYELSSYALTLSQEIPVETDGLAWDATGRFDIAASSQTIPLELSTNLRVFVVTAYAGGGVDLRQTAIAVGDASLMGPISVDVQGTPQQIGTAGVSMGLTGQAIGYVPRAFVGAQINVFFVKIYGQINGTLDEGFGGHLGARVAL